MKFATFALSMLGAALLPVSMAAAAQITYVFNGTASGTVSGKSFSDVSFSVTAVADTAGIPAPTAGLITITPGTLTVSNSASPQSVTVANTFIFDNQNLQELGFGEGSDDIVFTDPSFATYTLKTSAGPLSEASDPSIANWVDMPTSRGDLTVTSLTDLTFTATLAASGGTGPSAAVTLPSAAGMSLVGLALCAIAACRKAVVARVCQA
jgi:hypothetical protein